MNKVKYFRQSLGLTVKQLSEKANVSVGYISDIENNKETVNPTKETMERISRALNSSVQAIFFPGEE